LRQTDVKRKTLNPNSDFADCCRCDVHRLRCLRWPSLLGPPDFVAISHLEFAVLWCSVDRNGNSDGCGGQPGSADSSDTCCSRRRRSRSSRSIAPALDRMDQVFDMADPRNQPLDQLAMVVSDGVAGFLCGVGSRRNYPVSLAPFSESPSSPLTDEWRDPAVGRSSSNRRK
jgi:hypothetical protein